MRNRVYIADNMISVITYARRRLQKNADLDEEPTLKKTTQIMAEECIIDGNIIVIQIPNGNPIAIRRRLNKM